MLVGRVNKAAQEEYQCSGVALTMHILNGGDRQKNTGKLRTATGDRQEPGRKPNLAG